MTLIRVNPDSLKQSAETLKSLSGMMLKASDCFWGSANNAPSYEGQFGLLVHAIGLTALVQAKKNASQLNTFSGSLFTRASAFQSADSAGVMGLKKGGILPWMFIDGAFLAYLSMLSGLSAASILRLIGLGMLGAGNNRYGNPVNGVFGWISGVWNDFFGKNKETETYIEETGEILQGISDQNIQPLSYKNILLRQGDYNDVMGDNGHTIAQSGCLITCIAMIARYYGASEVTPRDVNNYIKNPEIGGYAKGTSNFPGWGLGEKFIENETGKSITYKPVSNSTVTETLKAGKPMVIHVKNYYHDKPETADGHWVVAVGINEKGDYVCLDAATGKERIYPNDRLHSKSNSLVYEEN